MFSKHSRNCLWICARFFSKSAANNKHGSFVKSLNLVFSNKHFKALITSCIRLVCACAFGRICTFAHMAQCSYVYSQWTFMFSNQFSGGRCLKSSLVRANEAFNVRQTFCTKCSSAISKRMLTEYLQFYCKQFKSATNHWCGHSAIFGE